MEKKHCFKVCIKIDGLNGSFIFAKEKQAVFETENHEEALECYKSQLKVLRELQCTDSSLGRVLIELEDTENDYLVISSKILASKRLTYSPMLHSELQQYLVKD